MTADEKALALRRIYESVLGGVLAITLLLLVIIPAPLGVALIAVPAIAPLSAYPGGTDPPASPVDFTLADKVHSLYMAHGLTLLLLSARVVRLAFVLSAILVGVSILALKLFEGRR